MLLLIYILLGGNSWKSLNAPVPSPTSVSYMSIASSADGQQVIAVQFGGYVYLYAGRSIIQLYFKLF